MCRTLRAVALVGLLVGSAAAGEQMLSPVKNRTCSFAGPAHPRPSDFDSDVHCFARFAFCGFANCSLSSDLPSFGKEVALCGCAPYGGTASNGAWDGSKVGVYESQLGLRAGAPPAFGHLVNTTLLAATQDKCPHGVKSCSLEPPDRVAPICGPMHTNPGAVWPGLHAGGAPAAELAAIGLKGAITYLSTSSQCTRPIPDEIFEPSTCGPSASQGALKMANCMLAPCYNADFDGGPAGRWPVTCVCPVEEVLEATFGLKGACNSPKGFAVSGVSALERAMDPSAWDYGNASHAPTGAASASQKDSKGMWLHVWI